MTKIKTFAGAAALLLMSSAAFAAPLLDRDDRHADKEPARPRRSIRRPPPRPAPAPRPSSPGTVGAMNKAGSAAPRPRPADVKAQDKGKPTAAQAAKATIADLATLIVS